MKEINFKTKVSTCLLVALLTANYAHGQYYGGYGYGGGGSDLENLLESLGPIFSIILGLIVLLVAYRIIRNFLRKGKSSSGSMGFTPPQMGLRGKTKEQKQIVKYFMSTGILGMIFRISDSTFDNMLKRKVEEFSSQIETRALDAHGMDSDEVKETRPILVENYYLDAESRYFKMFRDETFRTSEYQMTYLMFSEKQMYAYRYVFDLASANTTEKTNEYFYEDITNVEVTQKQIEFLSPRPIEYIIGGIAAIIIGILMMPWGSIFSFLGFLTLVVGVIITAFLGFSRRTVDTLTLKLTVPGNEFICAMNPENIAAIQGMKAKLREKKQ